MWPSPRELREQILQRHKRIVLARDLADTLRQQAVPRLQCSSSSKTDAVATNSRFPLTLAHLKRIAEIRGIEEVRFSGGTLARGFLIARHGGKWEVVLGGKSERPSAKMALAHEIAHTYLINRNEGPENSEHKADAATDRQDSGSMEDFCWLFARALLLPEDVIEEVLGDLVGEQDPQRFLGCLEKVSRSWGVSVLATLQAANEKHLIQDSLFALVLRRQPHYRTGIDPQVRICQNLPRPARFWYLPPNQRAATVGLQGALTLWKWWERFPHRQEGRVYRSSGVLGLASSNGKWVITENAPAPSPACSEYLRLWSRQNPSKKWRRECRPVSVAYRLYATGPTRAYCVAIGRVDETVGN